MKIYNVCILSSNVEGMKKFYEEVLEQDSEVYGDDYVVFDVGGCFLSIYDIAQHKSLISEDSAFAANRSVNIELEVDDADAEYQRMLSLNIHWVKPPATMPWGYRTFFFRDPEGNLVALFSRQRDTNSDD